MTPRIACDEGTDVGCVDVVPPAGGAEFPALEVTLELAFVPFAPEVFVLAAFAPEVLALETPAFEALGFETLVFESFAEVELFGTGVRAQPLRITSEVPNTQVTAAIRRVMCI